MFVFRVNIFEKNNSQTKKTRLLEQRIKRILLLSKVRNSCKVMVNKK